MAPRLAPWLSLKLSDEERRLVEPALLYVSYHRFVLQIDAHIERQAKLSGAPLAVTFGEDVIARPGPRRVLRGSGRALLRCFQLRRTFYFIYRSLAGECESMRRLRESVWNNVFTHDMRGFEAALWNRMEDFSTLILGETGTGKGQVAAAIGRSGFIPYLPAERRFAANFAESFIAINLSQFPESLIESGAGHRKGHLPHRPPRGRVRTLQCARRALPRRDRRGLDAGPDQAAAGAAGAHLHAARRTREEALLQAA